MGNEKTTLDNDFVDCSTIYTHVSCVILLWRKKCGNRTLVQTLFDEFFVK